MAYCPPVSPRCQGLLGTSAAPVNREPGHGGKSPRDTFQLVDARLKAPGAADSVAYAGLFVLGISAVAATLFQRLTPIVRRRLDPTEWARLIPAEVRRILTPHVAEEMIYQAERGARGIVSQCPVVTLHSRGVVTSLFEGRPVVDPSVAARISFHFPEGRVLFVSHQPGVKRRLWATKMIDPPYPSDAVDLHAILVRHPNGAVLSWKRFAEEFGFCPREVLDDLCIPLEVGGTIRLGPAGPQLDEAVKGCSVRYRWWKEISNACVAPINNGLRGAGIALFHSHPDIGGRELSIVELILSHRGDLSAYLCHLKKEGGGLADVIVTLEREDLFFSVMIPKQGVMVDSQRLMASVPSSRRHATRSQLDDYLRGIREYFDQYLLQLRPSDRAGSFKICSVRVNPPLPDPFLVGDTITAAL